MIKLIILSTLLSSCLSQYAPNQNFQQQPPRQYDSGHYNPNQYQAPYQAAPAQSQAAAPRQQSGYQFGFSNAETTTTPRPGPNHPPAQVHYVNIGPELAGDYKFGYDTGKGPAGQSFREEVRLPDGTVKGAYGYIDADGKMRIVKYTAGLEGFKVDSDAPTDGPSSGQAAQPRPRPQPQQYAPPPQPIPVPVPRPQPQYQQPRQAQPVPSRQVGPPAIPAHSLEQLQAFNRPPPSVHAQPQPQAPTYRTVVPYYGAGQAAPQQQAPPQYNHNALPRAQGQPQSFGNPNNKVEEEVTYGPPVIIKELLNYNIGVGK